MENTWLNLMNLFKWVLIKKEIAYHSKNKKQYLINLLRKGLLNSEAQKKYLIVVTVQFSRKKSERFQKLLKFVSFIQKFNRW